MLIRFNVGNFLSFAEEVQFSMVPGKGLPRNNQIIQGNNLSVLKAGILYGANASGKSSFIKAMHSGQEIILKRNDKGVFFSDDRFKLDNQYRKLPTKFEYEIDTKNGSYAYGFTFYPDRIEEEWLYLLTGSSEVMLFERKGQKYSLNDSKFNKKEEKKRLSYMFDDVLPNQLFLTEVNNRSIETIKTAASLIDVYNWFEKNLTIIYPDAQFRNYSYIVDEESFRSFMKSILKSLDTGITDILFENMSREKIMEEIPDSIMEFLEKNMHTRKKVIMKIHQKNWYLFEKKETEIVVQNMKTRHAGDTLGPSFSIDEESDGTKRVIDISPFLINLINEDKVILIDEIDRSLHPEITHKLLDIFLNAIDKSCSQLITSTHDVGLLDLSLFRKDEIWFIEKDNEGKSKMYSLYEFKPRKDENIKKGYLLGRYGAIPFIDNSVDDFLKEASG